MEKDEPLTLLDCGCHVYSFNDGYNVDITFCPIHNAAPDLLEALEFYANEKNWEFPEPPPAPLEWDPEPSRVIDDGGEIARAAIAKARGGAAADLAAVQAGKENRSDE